MTGPKRNRVGQRIGSLEVLADHARTKRGKVLWRCIDHTTGKTLLLRTDDIIRLDRLAQTEKST